MDEQQQRIVDTLEDCAADLEDAARMVRSVYAALNPGGVQKDVPCWQGTATRTRKLVQELTLLPPQLRM